MAGPHVRDACRRHIDDLVGGAARGLYFDCAAATRALDFFVDVLQLNGGQFEGLPFELLPWQAFIVGSLFGWKRKDGTRRFREAFVEAGKGSGKSPLAAGIGLYMMVADGEARAEVYAAATRRDQAMVLFRDAVAMVRQSELLRERITTQGRDERCWNMGHRKSASFFRPIASDDTGQSGPRPHCGLIDEIHEHKNATVINMLRAGKKGRRQPLIFMITNSGFDRASVCYEQHEYAIRIASGALQDDAYFSYVCAMDPTDEPFEDEACWVKANPSIGTTIGLDYLREQIRITRGMPSLESTVRRLNFCQWVDADNPWISGPLFYACEVGYAPLVERDDTGRAARAMVKAQREREALRASFRGREVCGGLDLSGTQDLTAAAFVARNEDDTVDAFVELWTPRETMRERGNRDGADYVAWNRAGYIHAVDGRNGTEGRIVDYNAVARRLGALSGEMSITGVACDPWRMAEFKSACTDEGVELPFINHGQGFGRSADSGLWMPRSIELLEQLIFEKRLRVVFNPCLRWNVSNAVIEQDGKENRVFKKRKAIGRIDGLVALTMAVGLLLNHKAEEPPEYKLFFM
ncbi:terminase large subunit [Paraburkholderia youngii]|uniref:terminase large subunit n=1 Tax=Paraburkholderia youngii TaxID=2782701 RepID=UPI003D1B7B6E